MQKQAIKFDNTAVAFAHKSDKELRKSNFIFGTMQRPWMVSVGIALTKLALRIGLPIKGIIRETIFNQFCGGESIEDCKKAINHLDKFDVKTILDYSVEGASNDASFERTKREIVEVCRAAKGDLRVPFCVVKLTGIGSMKAMISKQSGSKLSLEMESQLIIMNERALEIAMAAKESEMFFMIDAEESWMQDVADEVAFDLMRKLNLKKAIVYNTYQMYRWDALERLKKDLEIAKKEGFHLGAKLVRGAYMEKERDRAEEHGYASPIQPDKESTDKDYDLALRLCLENIDHVGLCAGTHNEGSSEKLTQLIDEFGLSKDDSRVYFAQLLGMSDHISFNLADAGYNVAKYVPYGPVEKVMPYLFRRADENTSIAGQSSRELTLVKKEIKRRKSA